MKTLGLLLALLVVVGVVPAALADNGNRVSARLSGYNEVITAGGAVSTLARGRFRATIAESAQMIHYVLTYEGFATTAPGNAVTQAHIHFGQTHTTGGISVWLCQTAGTPHPVPALRDPAITPFCPLEEGTVNGTITPAEVIGPAGQGIAAGEFAELVRAIRAGATYTNVHSTTFGGGEIRGQITGGGDGNDDDD